MRERERLGDSERDTLRKRERFREREAEAIHPTHYVRIVSANISQLP